MRVLPIAVPVCLALTLALGLGLAVPGAAQSVSDVGGPAEVPPASYTANQYVDSRGCVFIRAGFGGNTTWVPRVSRSRQVLCGYTPSLDTRAAAAPAAAAPRAAPEVVRTAPAATTASPAPRPGTGTTGQVFRPAGSANTAGASTPSTPRTTTTILQEPVAATAAASAGPSPAGRTVASGCPNFPAADQRYLRGEGVRCGPQPHHPGGGPAIGQVAGTSAAVVRPVQPVIPPGYRAAWEDGRLNPNRGPQTALGDAQMSMIWTDEVPRRAVEWSPSQGGTVYSTPILRGQNTPRAHAADDVMLVPRVAPTASSRTPMTRTRTVTAPRAPTAAAPGDVDRAPGHRFVLVGRYGSQADARLARDHLAARGLGASIGLSQRGGGTTYVVLAGPYGDSATLDRALQTARGAGFGGAVTRR